jgi:regulator of RNase E activity RraA
MLDNPPLLTIHRGFRRPEKALIEAFRGAQTSHLADAMDGRGALDYRIKPLDPANASFVGPALTAFAYPADIAAMFGALSEAEPGDVIVLANDGYTRTAVFGDIAAGMMKNKGVVVVPARRLRQILDRLAQVRSAETRTIALVEQGATMAAGAMRIIEKATIVDQS